MLLSILDQIQNVSYQSLQLLFDLTAVKTEEWNLFFILVTLSIGLIYYNIKKKVLCQNWFKNNCVVGWDTLNIASIIG